MHAIELPFSTGRGAMLLHTRYGAESARRICGGGMAMGKYLGETDADFIDLEPVKRWGWTASGEPDRRTTSGRKLAKEFSERNKAA